MARQPKARGAPRLRVDPVSGGRGGPPSKPAWVVRGTGGERRQAACTIGSLPGFSLRMSRQASPSKGGSGGEPGLNPYVCCG